MMSVDMAIQISDYVVGFPVGDSTWMSAVYGLRQKIVPELPSRVMFLDQMLEIVQLFIAGL